MIMLNIFRSEAKSELPESYKFKPVEEIDTPVLDSDDVIMTVVVIGMFVLCGC